jgi:O-antigen ligase
MEKNLANILFFLVASLPLVLVTGSFLPDLFVSISSIIFLYISFKNKLWNYYNNYFFKFFIILYIIINISSLFSVNLIISFKTGVFYIRFILFALAVFYLLDVKKNFEKVFFFILFFTITFLIIDGFVEHLSNKNLFSWIYFLFTSKDLYIDNSTRIQSVFVTENKFGSYLLRFSPIFFCILIKNNLKTNYNLVYIFLILILISIIYSGERAALILFLIFLFFNFVFLKFNIIYKFIKIFILIFIVTLIFNLDSNIKYRYFTTTKYLFYQLGAEKNIKQKQILEATHPNLKEYNNLNNYLALFQTSYILFSENIIVGHGPRSFKFLSGQERFSIKEDENKKIIYFNTHPHNYYLQLLAETGILGFSFLIFLFLFSLYFCINNFIINTKKKYSIINAQVVVFSSFFIYLWPLTTTASFFNNWVNIFHFLAMGFFLKYFYKN